MTVTYHSGRRIQGTQADFDGIPAVSGGWKELARTTLGSAGDTISVSSLADKRYYMILGHIENTGGDTVSHVRANSDSGANYALRRSKIGLADLTETSTNRFFTSHNSKSIDSRFIQGYVANKSDKEKLGIFQVNENPSTGAGTVPSRIEGVGKHAQTSSALNELQLFNDEAGSFDTGGELVVLGWDPADTHTDNFWEELASVEGDNTSATLSTGTFTSKKYLWIQGYGAVSTGTANLALRVGNTTLDSGTNYAFRYSDNGGADGTAGSQTSLVQHQLTGNGFFNCFIINNTSNEKLGISHHVYESATGSGTAPQRQEQVGKWANTSNQINIVGIVENGGSSKNWVSPTILKVWGAD